MICFKFLLILACITGLQPQNVSQSGDQGHMMQKRVSWKNINEKYKNKNMLTNVAQGKPAVMTNTDGEHTAAMAVDGDKDNSPNAPTCCMSTQIKFRQRWRVELGELYRIYFIDITPMWVPDDATASSQMRGFNIYFFNGHPRNPSTSRKKCFTSRNAFNQKLFSNSTVSVECEYSNLDASYVTIVNGYNRKLILCEVELYGVKMADLLKEKNGSSS